MPSKNVRPSEPSLDDFDFEKFHPTRSRIYEMGKRPPMSAQLIYLVGQTLDNESSVLSVAHRFGGPVAMIGHDGTEGFGYPGFSAWKKKLTEEYGALGKEIIPIMGSLIPDPKSGKTIIDTLSEMQALVEFAKEHEVEDIILVAPEFHLTRAYMTVVHAVNRIYPELVIYPALGAPLAWDEQVSHSQGMLRARRIDLLFHEMQRIMVYGKQGNLASPQKTLDYLADLDRAAP